jgi:hypothetical protein
MEDFVMKSSSRKIIAAALAITAMTTALATTVSAERFVPKVKLQAGVRTSGLTGAVNAEGKPERWEFSGVFNENNEPIIGITYDSPEEDPMPDGVNLASPVYNEKGELIKETAIPDSELAEVDGVLMTKRQALQRETKRGLFGITLGDSEKVEKNIVSSVNVADKITLEPNKSKLWNFDMKNFGGGDANDDQNVSLNIVNGGGSYNIKFLDVTTGAAIINENRTTPYKNAWGPLDTSHKYSVSVVNLAPAAQSFSVSLSSYR